MIAIRVDWRLADPSPSSNWNPDFYFGGIYGSGVPALIGG